MPRFEAPREDLLAEATALVYRLELTTEDWSEPVFSGFRRNGAASFYFGPEFVIQFNAARQLRRGFWGGEMLVAEKGRLFALHRHAEAAAVRLQRRPLTAEESTVYLEASDRNLQQLGARLASGEYALRGQVPPDGGVVDRLREWLPLEELVIAARPHAAGPRQS